MAEYISKYTGPQIDEAVGMVLAGTTSVTADSIKNALGYTPADKTVTDTLTNKVATLEKEVANGITDEDKAAIALQVLDMIEDSTAQVVVDDSKNITLSGDLADGAYTLKYLNSDGSTSTIATLTISGGSGSGSGGTEEPEEPDTPVDPDEPTEPDTTLTWSIGTKLNSSTGAEETGTAYAASNYIEFVDGWTYTLMRKQDSAIGAKVCYYDASKNFLSTSANELIAAGTSGDLSAVVPVVSGAKYFRIRFYNSNGATEETCAKVTLSATK